MRFALIDRIVELEPGIRITAVKSLTLTEEYLQDHFPRFPVMPGVLMLEAMVQAATWLLRASDDFSHSMVLLKEAKNVKYSGFVRPGQSLRVMVQWGKREGTEVTFRAEGHTDAKLVVSARLILYQFNLADQDPRQAATDVRIRERLRRELDVLAAPLGVAAR
jgi:3-hydroxyacyl-[acyl-carrier-protein] dehydratase